MLSSYLQVQKPEVWLPEFTHNISSDCLLQWGLVYFTAHGAQCAGNLTWHSTKRGHSCRWLQWQRYGGTTTLYLFHPVEFWMTLWTRNSTWYSCVNYSMWSFRAFEGASGEVHSWSEESTSDPCKEERGAGQGSAPGCFHSHRGCADFPWLSLWVSWGLAGAPATQVRYPSIVTSIHPYIQSKKN